MNNLDNSNSLPPLNPQFPNRDDHDTQTRKTLHLISFILLILTAVGTGLVTLYLSISLAIFQFGDDEVSVAARWTVFLIVMLAILPMFVWSIVASVLANRYYRELGTPKEKQHLAFAICVLIFSNIVSGILLIVAETLPRKNI